MNDSILMELLILFLIDSLDMQKRWNKLGCDVMINTVDPPAMSKTNMIKPSDSSGGTGTRASSSGSGGDISLEVKPPTVNISPKDLARIVQLTPKVDITQTNKYTPLDRRSSATLACPPQYFYHRHNLPLSQSISDTI